MNVLVIGSGGREHALTWAIARSPRVQRLFCAPGNPGMAALAECAALDSEDHAAVIGFCKDNDIGLVVIGPEAPLVAGLADALSGAGIKAFGPSARAAQLEGSKGFTKALCERYSIPTAAYGRFSDEASARAYISANDAPIVIKADGLAAGKGVTVAETKEQAFSANTEIFSGAFGAAGSEVVIEEFLEGEEASVFALCDGETVMLFGTAQDHKRVGDGDTGPNTGGMGAYSPAPIMTEALIQRTLADIIEPTVRGMAEMGAPYKGVLYAGLMITEDGPKLIEYNCRFGDPECQVLMPRLKSDLVEIMLAVVDGTLDKIKAQWSDDTALTVVMAAEGYPGSYTKGSEIKGIGEAEADGAVTVFHAGTAMDGGRLVANGGRVLNVTAVGKDVAEAQARAYKAVARIDWPDGFYRSDIGWRAVGAESAA